MTPRRFRLLVCFFVVLFTASTVLRAGKTDPVPTVSAVRGKVVGITVPAGYKSISLQQKTGIKNRPVKLLATRDMDVTGGNVVIVLRTAVARKALFVTGERATPEKNDSAAGIRLFPADPALQTSRGFSGIGGSMPGLVSMASTSSISLNLTPTPANETRSVKESDIWRISGNRLYFFNEYRGLQVFDVSDPDDPALLGQLREPNHGEQMYLLDAAHVALLTRRSSYFTLNDTAVSLTNPALDPNNGAVVIADVSAGKPREVARVPYAGNLIESRLVGTALYLVSDVYSDAGSSVQVTSFDLSDPENPQLVDTLSLGQSGGVITATDRFLFVVRYTDDWRRSTIDVIDISAPNGNLVKRGKIDAAGTVRDKFKMHLEGDVLTVVSAVPRSWTEDPNNSDNFSRTAIETFSLARPAAPVKLGSLSVGVGETVRATRFADGRLYVVTFFSVDPLWVIDLSEPKKLKVLGELEIPGFSNYIEPLGDRLVGVGRVGMQTAVSLFDVSDPAHPTLLSQIPLGDYYSSSAAEWDEKAVTIIPDHEIILLPYSGYQPSTGYANQVQLITLKRDSLTLRGVVGQAIAVRRTGIVGHRFLAISSGRLITLNLSDRDHPVVTSDVEIASRVERALVAGSHLLQLGSALFVADHPAITVSTAAEPDVPLNVVDLDNIPIVGASVHNGRLYLAQQDLVGSWWGPIYLTLSNPTGQTQTTPPAHPLVLSVYDLSNLPALTRLSRTESNVAAGPSGASYSQLQAVWTDDETLVWVRSAWTSWWWGGPIGIISPILFTGNALTLSNAVVTTANAGIVKTGTGTLNLSAGTAANSGTLNISGAVTFNNGAPSTSAAATGEARTQRSVTLSASTTITGSLAVAGSSNLAINGVTSATSSLWIRPWSYYNQRELIVFDATDPAAPKFGAAVKVPGGSTGDWSEPIAAAGKLYLSYLAHDEPTGQVIDVNTTNGTLPRRYRHFLTRVNFSDPAKPVFSNEVNIPGRLLAVQNGGTTFMTVGCGFDSSGLPSVSRVFHTSHFDGTSAQLVDQLETPTVFDPYAVEGANLFVGTWPSGKGQTGLLQAWTVGADEKFTLVGQLSAPVFRSLDTLHGLLGGFGNGTPHLFDVTDPANIVDLSNANTRELIDSDFRRSDGGPGQGIWQAQGDYGVGAASLSK